MIQAVQEYGGLLTLQDLQDHRTDHSDPICIVYRGVKHLLHPPSHGLSVLLALQFPQQLQPYTPITPESFSILAPDWQSKFDVEEIHRSLECMRRAY